MKTALKKTRIADAELSRLIRKGQRSGAEVLYDTYASFLFLAISRIVAERQVAELALQTTFHKIWCSIDEFSVEKEPIYTWMIAIARKTAYEALSESKRNYEDKSESVYASKG